MQDKVFSSDWVLGGKPLAGFTVGVLCIETRHPLLPGNVQHARTFPAPVLYEIVPIQDFRRLMRGDPTLTDAIIEGGQRLVARGVGAVVGACGSFAHYQTTVAKAVDVPVFLSILSQVPWLQLALGWNKKLLILCASKAAITDNALRESGIADQSTLIVREMSGNPEFDRILRGEPGFSQSALRDEVVGVVEEAIRQDPDIAGVLLQCSDLPPFGRAIQKAVSLPVFDMSLLIQWLQMTIDYPKYQ